MKLRLDRDALADAVTWAARALPSRAPVPVLAGLMLEATADTGLCVSAFDYESSARAVASAEVATPGTGLVPGRLLADICKSLPARPVDLSVDGSKVRLTCGGSKFTLLTMPTDDYPTLPTMPDTAGTIPGGQFAAAVAQVAVAASRDDSPPMLAGVRVEIDGDQVTLLATDRYRLALRTLPWNPSTPDLSAGAIIRARTLTDVSKGFGVGDVTLALSNDGGKGLIGFEAGGRRTTSLLMDGEYPKVRALFPKDAPIHATVDVHALTEAVRRVSLVVEKHTAVKVTFTEDTVTVEGGQGADAQATETVDADLTGTGQITVGFNPQFLLDGLAHLGTPLARIALVEPVKPAVLTGATPSSDGTPVEDDTYRYLLMPMRL